MKRIIKKVAQKARNAAGIPATTDLVAQLVQLNERLEAMAGAQQRTQQELEETRKRLEEVRLIVKSNRDNIPRLREQLLAVRKTDAYKKVFDNKHPLITVRIATYNRADLLVGRTIPSIQAQTYDNWELIVVGDHCPDDTEARIKALNDPRIRFYNFPHQNVYPDNPLHRWYSAGTPGMNKGVELAKGDWIAPQDDDDEFTPDHLEVLLKTALGGQFEMVYGKLIQYNTKTKQTAEIFDYPPKHGSYGSQGAMYMKLLDFIEYDTQSWVVDEPGDWNFCRRMLETGVRIGATDQVVGKLYHTPKV